MWHLPVPHVTRTWARKETSTIKDWMEKTDKARIGWFPQTVFSKLKRIISKVLGWEALEDLPAYEDFSLCENLTVHYT